MIIKVILTVFVVSVAFGTEPEFEIRVIEFCSSAHGTAVNRPSAAVRIALAGAEGAAVNFISSVCAVSVRGAVLPAIIGRTVPAGVVAVHVAAEISPRLPLASAHALRSMCEEEENNRAGE